MFKLSLVVGNNDIEAPYNHVHHAHSLRFLERGRVEYLRSRGIEYDSYLSRGLFLVITSIEIQYKRELLPGLITVTCATPIIDGKEITIPQTILNHKGKLAIEAEVRLTFMSQESRRSIEPESDFLRAVAVDRGE